ncbi:Thioester-containing protein [Frankliniella occidentalis]|nr:Thioester-containing protein [Frankliniella occidentalis]
MGTQVVFEASVEEALTGRKQNASGPNHTTRISRSDFEIKFVDTPFEFTPGQPFLAKVAVTDLLGAPVQDDKHAVILQIWPDHEWKTPKVLEKKMLSNGIVTLELKPEIDWYFLKVQAIYKEHTCSQTSKRGIALFDTDAQLVTKITNKCPQLGDDIELHVKSKALRKVTVLVVGPLGVEEVQTVQTLLGQEGWREAVVRFKATEYMAPASRVLVHGVGDDGELYLDAAALELAGPFTPLVEVRVDPGRSEPGRDVAVQVAAAPNARVALLAVDQSALLLAGEDARNGISHDDLRAERLTFNTSGSACGFRKSLWPKSTLRCLPGTEAAERFPRDLAVARNRRGVCTTCSTPCPQDCAATMFYRADGRAVLEAAVPDTITSWVVSALAVDPVHGLGLSDTSKLTVFRPFFASLSLPYSVIRGETVEVPVLVFNYLAEPTTATVTMTNDRGEFDFVEGGRSATRTVAVAAQGSASVCFNITAIKVGSVLLRVTARSDSAGDALELPLKVKAEGETQYRNRAIPIDLSKRKAFNAVVRIDMPGAVPDSENIQVSAIGELAINITSHFENARKTNHTSGICRRYSRSEHCQPRQPDQKTLWLWRTEHAELCSQHCHHDIPEGRSNPLVEAKARSFSEIGYQKELTYRHDDGSFSAFGEHDESGSTWLTAFVAMSFALARASALVQVDLRVVQQALAWLAKQQAKDGSFPEVGSVFQRDMQGGAAKGLALTAYVLTAFLQDKDLAGKHKDTVGKAVQYLVDNLECLDEPYAIAVTTHALHVADHPAKDKAFAMLEARAVTKAGLRFWSKPREKDLQPNSLDVEMTAYALMTYVSRRLLGEAMPIMQWLIHQRNSNGGFPSTQDTVVGLRALASMAELISFPLGDMTVRFKHRGRGEATMAVNSKTSMVLQKEELPRDVREVEVDAEGAGFALAQVSWSFNENTPTEYPLFHLKVTVGETTRPHLLALSIISSFIGGSWGTESNMTVVEVTLPSGFTTDQDTMAALRANEDVRRAETKDKDTVVVLYFDKMDSKREYCVDVSAVRTHLVTQLKPVPITVYDYYDQSRQARVFYDLSRPV